MCHRIMVNRYISWPLTVVFFKRTNAIHGFERVFDREAVNSFTVDLRGKKIGSTPQSSE